ncbi:hypothetical protein V3C99_016326 [Haemonchus contortus]|uniref:RNA-directed DNA polymerase, eukaryota, reverse transcriptase zinc-binding domain protein n=1 Tax=Haemonchus contortus TaxID=6289 RepID=A0A7I4YY92_HAECO
MFYLRLDEAIQSVLEWGYLTIGGDPNVHDGRDWKGCMEVEECDLETKKERVLDQGQKKSAYKRKQRTRALEDLAQRAYTTFKRVAKAAVAKAKHKEINALFEILKEREGETFVLSLAEAVHRSTQDIRVVKSSRSREDAILKKPGEVMRRWKEYFNRLLNEEFACKKSSLV